jgi:hypothetical protein
VQEEQAMITNEELKKELHYDPETGVFTWVRFKAGRRMNRPAGCKRRDGYQMIMIDGKLWYAHRLAWLYVYGVEPSKHIDHINRNPSDNRISNLRDVSQIVNMCNAGISTKNKSGFKGVHWNKTHKKWTAQCKFNGKAMHLGLFDNKEEAAAVYQAFNEKKERMFA